MPFEAAVVAEDDDDEGATRVSDVERPFSPKRLRAHLDLGAGVTGSKFMKLSEAKFDDDDGGGALAELGNSMLVGEAATGMPIKWALWVTYLCARLTRLDTRLECG